MKTVGIILGTRPEVIKFAPLIFTLRESKSLKPFIISTGQHKELLEQALRVFDINPDIELSLMSQNQSPNTFLGKLLSNLGEKLEQIKPDCVLVQGDTTTALGGALTAFHHKISLGHVEAGLRTHDIQSPFPEEMNRVVISKIVNFHFCPTKLSATNLKTEGITDNVFVVGNTIVDALKWIENNALLDNASIKTELTQLLAPESRFLLVTGHRRENFDKPLENLCSILLRLVDDITDIEIIYPVHLNPNVQSPAHRLLGQHKRIHLLPPVDYPSLLYLIKNSALIISDSGGIHEEAPSFGTHVLITRELTERPEAIEGNFATLTDLNNPELLYQAAYNYLTNVSRDCHAENNPFGDGTAARQITEMLAHTLSRA